MAGATGTTVKHVSRKVLRAFEAVLPPSPLAKLFEQIAFPGHLWTAHNSDRSPIPDAICDAFPTKPMSSEIPVNDVERFLGAGA
jgi:hypothetical protein